MKTIKRSLMGGYVEFSDGTYGKQVEMDRLVQLARNGLDAHLTVTEDDTVYMDVHEDEASAFEPELFLDMDDDEWSEVLWDSMTSATETFKEHERKVCRVMTKFYDMYSSDPASPLMLTDQIVNADIILENLWVLDEKLYDETLRALREDMATDMKTILTTMDVVHSDVVKNIFDTYMQVWFDLNNMEGE